MNTILNIVLPIISLVVLNILVSTIQRLWSRAGMGDVNIQPIQSPVHRLVLSTVQPQAQSGPIQLKLVLVRVLVLKLVLVHVLVLKLVLVQVSRRIEAHLKSLDANDAASASFKANQRLTRQVLKRKNKSFSKTNSQPNRCCNFISFAFIKSVTLTYEHVSLNPPFYVISLTLIAENSS